MGSSASPTGGPGASAIASRAVEPETLTYERDGPDRADHARPPRARQRDHARDAARARRLRRARQPRPRGPRDRARRQRHRLLRRLRPRLRRATAGHLLGFASGGAGRAAERRAATASGSPIDPAVVAANHDPTRPGIPVVDFQMMSRNVRGFMSLFWSEKPVICKVHGYCVAGGTDMALCSDLLVVEDGRRSAIRRRASGACRRRRCGRTGSARRGRSACCSPATRSTARGGRVGAGDRVRRRRPSSTARSRRCSSASRGCRSTSS